MLKKTIFDCDPADIYDVPKAAEFLDVPLRQMHLYVTKNKIPSVVTPSNAGGRGRHSKHVILKSDLIKFKAQREKEAAWPREKQIQVSNLEIYLGKDKKRLQKLEIELVQARYNYVKCPNDATIPEFNALKKALKRANNRVKHLDMQMMQKMEKLRILRESE